MRIGTLARRAGCDVQAVRHYEREGLLAPPPREEASGYRRYDEADLERLRFIRHCRSLDMPIPEIRELLRFAAAPDRPLPHVDALLDRHLARVRERLRTLRDLERQLAALHDRCAGDAGVSCAILESFLAAGRGPGTAEGGASSNPVRSPSAKRAPPRRRDA